MPRLSRNLLILLLAFPLIGCSSSTAEDHMARATSQLAEGEVRAALIELKNAVQKAPELADARLMLAEAHQAVGDEPSALKEFERALDLGLDNDRVRLGLLRAKVRTGRHQEVVGELGDGRALSPAAAVILGDAYLSGGDVDRAEPNYRLGAGLPEGALGLGRIAAARGDRAGAMQQLERAIELDPGNANAWLQKGDLQLEANALDDAEASFRTAMTTLTGGVVGRFGLSRARMMQGDLEGAGKEVDAVLRAAPDYPQAHYLKALISFQQEDFPAAEASIRQVQRVAPRYGPSLYLMASIKYRQQQFSQAEDQIRRFLAQEPVNPEGLKLLASMQFDQGNYEGVVDTLRPVAESSNDAQLLAMLGTAQLRLGQSADATASFSRAVALAPERAQLRSQLALSLMARGDSSAAEDVLVDAVDGTGDQFQNEHMLAMLRLQSGDLAGASVVIDRLLAEHPDQPIPYHLQGLRKLLENDFDGSEAAFREALKHDGAFLPAAQILAQIALQRNDRERARKIYEDLLAQKDDDEGALMALAELVSQDGDVAMTQGYLERAARANPGSVRPRIVLARLLASQDRRDEAGRYIQEGLALSPGQGDLLLLQAELNIAADDLTGARATLAALQEQVLRQPENAALHLAVGSLQLRLGQQEAARTNLERALALSDGNNPQALLGLARLDLAGRDVAAARQRLDALSALGASGNDFELLQADLLMVDERAEEAAQAYQQLIGRGVRDAVLRLGSQRQLAGDLRGAASIYVDWLASRPADTGVRFRLADVLMKIDPKQAVPHYEQLVETGNAVVLNNLAWLYMQAGDPRATDLGRQAVAAAPDNPAILDTLGWILTQDGNPTEGVTHLRRSVELNGDDPSIRYHLAVALRDTGALAEARAEFERALAAGEFSEAADARAALAALAAR
jgi:putative PEP-CTERM system TPR-repeat lipoprotein